MQLQRVIREALEVLYLESIDSHITLYSVKNPFRGVGLLEALLSDIDQLSLNPLPQQRLDAPPRH